MRVFLITLVLIVVGFIPPHAHASTCSYNRPTAPLCPVPPNTMLNETYPAQAFVIGGGTGYDSGSSTEANMVPVRFATEIFRSHGFNPNQPQVILNVNDQAQFDDLVSRITNSLRTELTATAGMSPEQVNQRVNALAANLKMNIASDYTWQQDYFESFFDPATGMPVIRQVESYPDGEKETESVNGLPGVTGACGVTLGAVLGASPNGAGTNTEMGGNIEGLPGGVCMVGDNQEQDYTDQFCSDHTKVFEAPTSWLSVGHADEIIKVIPNNPATGACPYTFMFASPSKGLELLNQNSHDLIMDFGSRTGQDLLDEVKIRYDQSNPIGAQICKMYSSYIGPARAPAVPQDNPNDNGSSKVEQVYFQFGISDAHAGIQLVENTSRCPDSELATITNGELYDAIQANPDLKKYNELVQAQMNQAKAQLRSRYSQCGESAFVDMPDIFYGDLMEVNGQLELTPQSGSSFFPNPTNSVRTGNTILYPDPMNEAFRRYIRQNPSNGTTPRFIDTWNYAHVGDGNLHCSSHSMRYCTPRSSR